MNPKPTVARKLTDEMQRYIVERRAIGTTCQTIVDELKSKYNVDISTNRIVTVCNAKKWFPTFNECQRALLKQSTNNAIISIAAKEHRIKEADKITVKLGRLIDKLYDLVENKEKLVESDIVKTKEGGGYVTYAIDNISKLVREYQSFLKYAKDETEIRKKDDKGNSTSFLINIGKIDDKEPAKIVDIQQIEGNNEGK